MIESWEDAPLDIRNFYQNLYDEDDDAESHYKKVWHYESNNKKKNQENVKWLSSISYIKKKNM